MRGKELEKGDGEGRRENGEGVGDMRKEGRSSDER